MAFNNPWGKGSGDHDRWFKNIWENENSLSASNPDDSDGAGDDVINLFYNPDEIFVTGREEIIVYIDPGHQYGPKGDLPNQGSESTKSYKHKVQVTVQGMQVAEKDKDNVEIEEIDTWSDIDTKPELKYVKDDIAKGKSAWEWTTGWISESKKPEHYVVYEIGNLVYLILLQLGYSKAIISRGAQGGPILKERIAAANKLSAHYYISLHSDGDPQNRYTLEECFGIYYPDKDNSTRQEVFADDMMSYYTHSGNNRGASISRNKSGIVDPKAYGITDPSQNLSIRRTILELGVTTNPKWFDNALVNKREIAKQLVLGLEANVNRSFFKKGKIIGYEFDGKKYKTEAEIPYSSRSSRTPNFEKDKAFPQVLQTVSTLPGPTWDEAKRTKTLYEKLPLTASDVDRALSRIPQ